MQKRIKAEKYDDRNRKSLYKLMSNAIYGRTMENLGNRINVKLVSIKEIYLK